MNYMKYFLEVLSPLLIIILISLAICLCLLSFFFFFQRPREKRNDKYNPLSPAIQWMNTAGLLQLVVNNGSFRSMAGYRFAGNENYFPPILEKMLWDYWKI